MCVSNPVLQKPVFEMVLERFIFLNEKSLLQVFSFEIKSHFVMICFLSALTGKKVFFAQKTTTLNPLTIYHFRMKSCF